LDRLVEAERLRGRLADALSAAEEMRTLAADDERAQVLRTIGELTAGRGEHRPALAVLHQAEALLRDDADDDGARVLLAVADVYYAMGEHDAATRHADQAVERGGGVVHHIRAQNIVGKIAYSKGRFDEAARVFLENQQR